MLMWKPLIYMKSIVSGKSTCKINLWFLFHHPTARNELPRHIVIGACLTIVLLALYATKADHKEAKFWFSTLQNSEKWIYELAIFNILGRQRTKRLSQVNKTFIFMISFLVVLSKCTKNERWQIADYIVGQNSWYIYIYICAWLIVVQNHSYFFRYA